MRQRPLPQLLLLQRPRQRTMRRMRYQLPLQLQKSPVEKIKKNQTLLQQNNKLNQWSKYRRLKWNKTSERRTESSNLSTWVKDHSYMSYMVSWYTLVALSAVITLHISKILSLLRKDGFISMTPLSKKSLLLTSLTSLVKFKIQGIGGWQRIMQMLICWCTDWYPKRMMRYVWYLWMKFQMKFKKKSLNRQSSSTQKQWQAWNVSKRCSSRLFMPRWFLVLIVISLKVLKPRSFL